MPDLQSPSTFAGRSGAPSRRFGMFLSSVLRAYVRWYGRRAAAHHLQGLDDRMLGDIGISRSQIESAVNDGRFDCRRHGHWGS